MTDKHVPTHRHDLEEALLAMAGSQTFRDAGIDERFAKVYAKHAHRFDLLPEDKRRGLAAQFSHLVSVMSYADSVGRKHPETLQRQTAAWLKGCLVFLVHATNHPSAPQTKSD